MDIVINGSQGAGKTVMVKTILNGFKDRNGFGLYKSDITHVHNLQTVERELVLSLRKDRVRAIVFDECIITPVDFELAKAAVESYRKRIGADVLAIYVTQSEIFSHHIIRK